MADMGRGRAPGGALKGPQEAMEEGGGEGPQADPGAGGEEARAEVRARAERGWDRPGGPPPAPEGVEDAGAFALRSARMGDWDFNLITGQARRSVIHDHCFGLFEPPASWTMEDFLQRVHPADRDRIGAELGRAMSAGGGLDTQFRVIWPDGSAHWLWTRGWAHAGEGGVERLSGVTMEVTEARERGDRLAYLANHDALTGLPNRALFHDRLEQALRNARRRKGRVGALYVDVDHFKSVNDTLGHAAGDELLQEIARRLDGCKREEDTVSRLGGDEFAILCPDASSREDVQALLERVYAAMARPLRSGGRELLCSLSAGAALYPEDALGEEELLSRADAALYAAKRAGRSRYEFYQESMGEREREGAGLGEDLSEALERGEIFLEYQPVVEIRSGRVVGAEALARWRHPRLGLIRPERWIPLAEQTGAIMGLGEWAARQAARDWARLSQAGGAGLTLSVNIAPAQLRHQGYAEGLARALDAEGAPRERVRVEARESALEMQSAREAACELSELGVGVCVDDFGGGCCCLERLAELPIRSVKLSSSLSSKALSHPRAAAIVKALCALADDLGAACVVKGVESAQEQAAFERLGARLAQGHHIAGPMRLEAFCHWLSQRPPELNAAQAA